MGYTVGLASRSIGHRDMSCCALLGRMLVEEKTSMVVQTRPQITHTLSYTARRTGFENSMMCEESVLLTSISSR